MRTFQPQIGPELWATEYPVDVKITRKLALPTATWIRRLAE
jgi:hypothetical protein